MNREVAPVIVIDLYDLSTLVVRKNINPLTTNDL
jgi:hypothetical protein